MSEIMRVLALIQVNVLFFGLEDFLVTGKVRILKREGVEWVDVRTEMKISEFSARCSDLRRWAEANSKFSWGKIGGIDLFIKDEKIGMVDVAGVFHYQLAPDFRSCLAWAIVTDLGQEKEVDYELSLKVSHFLDVIRALPAVKHENYFQLESFFVNDFSIEVQSLMSIRKGSRYSDGYQSFLVLFWTVGFRLIQKKETSWMAFLK